MAGKEKVPDDRGEKSVNLDIRKFSKNQALVVSFRILLLHFIAIKQFGGRINKKNKLVFAAFCQTPLQLANPTQLQLV